MSYKSYIVPDNLEERIRLRNQIGKYAVENQLKPPVALHNLDTFASDFIKKNGLNDNLKKWIMVELHNCVWMPTISSIPYDRRLLLLPKCLSHSNDCAGEIDELGLLCHKCGKCTIPSMQDRADEIGVLSMVAEGFTSVIELIENHVVDAVIGVSCMDSLEKAFPLLIEHAVPGVAIPLNNNGCKDTNVDVNYVMHLMTKHNEGAEIHLINHEKIKEEVRSWFSKEHLATVWDTKKDDVQDIAFNWLANEGKRWRPYLLTAVYQALTGREDIPEEVKKAAIAVECFHKASLVHDDIQDNDLTRYDKPTINAIYGDAIAINTGDLLLGVGYKLLASCKHRELVDAVADAHINLCQGQGAELAWTRNKPQLTIKFVLDVFRYKTVPAFEVALILGLICADCVGSQTNGVLKEYSCSLGIAYQLKDDLDDYNNDNSDVQRLSAALALQTEHPDWKEERIKEEMSKLVEHYHQKALNVLGKIDNLELKRLMFLVTEKILG